MIKFEFDTQISRPVEDVFAYMTDPNCLGEWQGTESVEQLTKGPVDVGTQFREVHKFMGRDLESTTEVTAYEPSRRFDIRIVSGSIPQDGKWTFEPTAEGTNLHFSSEGRGPVRILEPIMKVAIRSQFRRHHKRLKENLEAAGAEPTQ